eukprot:437953_1
MGAACSQCAGCCKSAGNSIEDAGSEIGTSLLEKGKTMSGQTGSRILSRVESTFDDKVDKIIAEKFLERCDTTFDSAIDAFVGKTFSAAMKTFDPTMEQQQSTGDSLSPEALRKKEERIARLEETREQLRYCGLSQLLIEKLEQEGWLDQRNWDILPKDQLFAMGFGHGHIELFMEAVHKNKQKKRNAAEQLARWDIPQFLIDNMNEEGYLDQDKWEELQEEALHCEREGKEAVSKLEEEKRREFEEKYPSEISKKRKKTRKDDRVTINEQLRHQRQLEKEEARKKKIKEEGPIVLPYTYTGCRLHRLGFAYNHIESFLDGMERQAKANKPPEHVLLECGIPNDVIENMRKCRVLSPEKWADLTSSNLDEMGFKKKDEDKLFKALAKISHGEKDNVMDTTNSLEQEIKTWGIPNVLMERMKEVGWLHPDYWDDLLEHEYELEDLGFQHGHISTFRRKYQQWKDKEALKGTQRKIMRKLERPAKKQSALLKRKIDIFNATSEPVRVRIIGERKYGSMESTSGSASSQKDQASSRRQGSSMSSKNKSIQDASNESTSDTTKERSFKGGASAQVSATPVNASLSVDMSKKDTSSKTNKAASHAENERQSARQSNDERSNKMSDATAVSAANTSQHSWDKVKVGFTSVMPNQTIEFPVQISDPNAVVYMTIFSFSGREPICDNVQIDQNYIKIDKVTIEGFGTKVRWQPGVKPPKSKLGGASGDVESIKAKNGIFTALGFCNYLEKRGIDGKKVKFMKDMLGHAEYDVNPTKENKDNAKDANEANDDENEDEPPHVGDANADNEEMTHLYAQIEQVLKLYNKKYGVNIDKDLKLEKDRIIEGNKLIIECIDPYLNTTLRKSILKFDVVAIDTDDDDEKGKKKVESMKRIDSLLSIDSLCLFLKNKGIASNKKIVFIHESLGGYGATYVLTKDTQETLKTEISKIIKIYDDLHELKRKERRDITLKDDEHWFKHFHHEHYYKQKINDYKDFIMDMKRFKEEHEKHAIKYEPFKSHRDDDSDDEELHSVEAFFDCDSHVLLESWGLSQFHERMVDEGWRNPLDWVHLDDHVLKQNIGFRPGHIQIFNRKFDLWVKRYNDVRRTIDPKRKGKDGVLIVGKGTTTTLKPNYLYIFTKVIIREGGTLTVKPWSPTQKNGGVLFMVCHQDIVLERDSKISVDGKGYWGSALYYKKGYGPGGGGSVGYACNGAGGASYAGDGYRGYNISEDEDVYPNGCVDSNEMLRRRYHGLDGRWETERFNAKKNDQIGADGDGSGQADDDDDWQGAGGKAYWDAFANDSTAFELENDVDTLKQKDVIKSLDCLSVASKRKSFPNREYATPEAMKRHRLALGSGGGCNIEIYQGKHAWKFRPKRGGAGGGAVRLWCDRLIMYEKSRITAEGEFDPYGDPLSSGGSGGSIFITVTSDIIPRNRDSNDKNIGLYALGGGRSKMDRMYLEDTWSDKEEEAIKKIRRFEKIDFPRSRTKAKKQKETDDDEKRKERERADYIDSDDEDDEDDGFYSDHSREEEAKQASVEPTLTFRIDELCKYLERVAKEQNNDSLKAKAKNLKENPMLKNEDGITFRKWVINDVYDVDSTDEMLCEILEAFEKAFNPPDDDKEAFNDDNNKFSLAGLGRLRLLPDSLRNEGMLLKHVKGYYKEEELAAMEKAWLKSEPIAVQIAMLKHEFKHQRDNTEASKVREEDLWLWKWKKMPKMPPMQQVAGDNESVNCDNEAVREEKEEESEIKKEKGKYDSKVLNLVFGDCLKRDEESGLFDSKARADWEWVGIGGHGVVRVDYHSPFTIGWDRCRPRAFLGTDVDDGNTGDEPQVTEFSKTFTQQYN